MLSFFVQGSEHSLLTQQENEGLVYQIWLFQIWSLRNHTHREEMSLRNIENQSILHQTLYLQGKKQNRNWCYISDLTDKGVYGFTSVHAPEKIVAVLIWYFGNHCHFDICSNMVIQEQWYSVGVPIWPYGNTVPIWPCRNGLFCIITLPGTGYREQHVFLSVPNLLFQKQFTWNRSLLVHVPSTLF